MYSLYTKDGVGLLIIPREQGNIRFIVTVPVYTSFVLVVWVI
jgi:hypothetical protein